MVVITNTRQFLSQLELPSPAWSSSTSITRLGNPPKKNIISLKNLAIASVSSCLAFTVYKSRDSFFSTGGGNGNGGSGTNGGFGGDGGGGDGGGGRFSGELLSCSANSEENDQSREVELQNKHSGLQKYVLSGICIRVGSETMFNKMNSGRVHPTKAQLLETELKGLIDLGIYQEMHLQDRSNLDGTIGVTATLIREAIDDEVVVIRCPVFQKNSGGTYTETKGQLQKLLEKGGDVEAGTNAGGTTIGLRPIVPEERMSGALIPIIQSDTRWDTKNGGVRYMQQSDDVKTECSIVTGCGGPLTLASLEPRGTMSFEHRNIQGNASIIGSVAFSELFHPQDDINCNVKYVQGNTFCLSAYKTIKLSPDLKAGVNQDHHPTWVDKVGFKANITENFTPQTNFKFGMVFEKITAHNRSNGQRLSDGTPTTPSGGNQRLYGQATLARDNTKFVNGAIVGDKIKFQIDHSLGLCETVPFFSRHQLTMTRFHQLKEIEEGVGKPSPPVLVLHARYGGYAGDLLPHDTFILGGPDSVRGYNVGEIGTARNILEVAAEVRVPVRNTQVYAFAEHGNDLGSSMGNPTEVHGSSYGVGAKLGFVRVEYAINHNSHIGELSVRFGERF